MNNSNNTYNYENDLFYIIKSDNVENFEKYIKENKIDIKLKIYPFFIGGENIKKVSLLTIALDYNAIKIVDNLIYKLKDPVDNIATSHDHELIIHMMKRYEDTKDPIFLIKMNMSYSDLLKCAIEENMDNTIQYALYKVMKEGEPVPNNLPQKYTNIIKNTMNKEINKLNKLPNNVTRYIIKPMAAHPKSRRAARKTRKSRKSRK